MRWQEKLVAEVWQNITKTEKLCNKIVAFFKFLFKYEALRMQSTPIPASYEPALL
jgi:hypothetical protein